MTAPRRARSAWLLVGSTPLTVAKVQSAGHALSRLRARPRQCLLRGALLEYRRRIGLSSRRNARTRRWSSRRSPVCWKISQDQGVSIRSFSNRRILRSRTSTRPRHGRTLTLTNGPGLAPKTLLAAEFGGAL